MMVFFYGLFMDEDLLAEKGITTRNSVVGFVEGFRLRIGERATLQRCAGERAYGVMMEIAEQQVQDLYAESSVADYVPESVTVEFADGSNAEASCFNLPDNKVTGTNRTYADSLLRLATRLDLPAPYLDRIRQAGR